MENEKVYMHVAEKQPLLCTKKEAIARAKASAKKDPLVEYYVMRPIKSFKLIPNEPDEMEWTIDEPK